MILLTVCHAYTRSLTAQDIVERHALSCIGESTSSVGADSADNFRSERQRLEEHAAKLQSQPPENQSGVAKGFKKIGSIFKRKSNA